MSPSPVLTQQLNTFATTNPAASWRTIAFQGMPGAYAHLAAKASCNHAQVLACESFSAAIHSVTSGQADGVILPVENSSMGRIADIHALLPHSGLHMVAEVYLPVHHNLLAVPGATLATVKTALSQPPALAQCTATLAALGLKQEAFVDTAGAAKFVAEKNDPSLAAVASSLAAEVYGLNVLKSPLNDHPHNTTRFVLLGKQGWLPPVKVPCKTTLLFKVRDIPAALYKALGGFATAGLNLSRLESYLVGGSFKAAEFFVDVEAHPNQPAMHTALEELSFYAPEIRLMGVYPRAENPAA